MGPVLKELHTAIRRGKDAKVARILELDPAPAYINDFYNDKSRQSPQLCRSRVQYYHGFQSGQGLRNDDAGRRVIEDTP